MLISLDVKTLTSVDIHILAKTEAQLVAVIAMVVRMSTTLWRIHLLLSFLIGNSYYRFNVDLWVRANNNTSTSQPAIAAMHLFDREPLRDRCDLRDSEIGETVSSLVPIRLCHAARINVKLSRTIETNVYSASET